MKRAPGQETLSHELSTPLKDFGERPQLKKTFEEINSDLRFAYQYVSQFVNNMSILDFGCGGGYGTEFLSRFTSKKTVGYDVSHVAINAAKSFFSTPSHLHFTYVLPQDRFDVVTSFQVVEHIEPRDLPEYFKTLCSHLQSNGTIFIATPNKNRTSYRLKRPIMPFHKTEYTPETFETLLRQYFHHVTVLGQIDQDTARKVAAGAFSYSDISGMSFKQKFIRMISQITLVRFVARHTPQELKNFILGQTSINTMPQQLAKDKIMIENSSILIAQCQC